MWKQQLHCCGTGLPGSASQRIHALQVLDKLLTSDAEDLAVSASASGAWCDKAATCLGLKPVVRTSVPCG